MRISPILMVCLGLSGQTVPARPAFDVVSVKVNTTSGSVDFPPKRSGDRVTLHNAPLEAVVNFAYGFSQWYQVVWNADIPDGWRWLDIEAIAPASTSEDDLRLMFQTMLADRFGLKVHRETRDLSEYNLVPAKGGSRMKAAVPDSKIGVEGRYIGAGRSQIGVFNDGAHLMGKGATVEQLVASLSARLRAPVNDRTGLTGTFDYNVTFSRDDNPTELASAPFLTTAIESELGLKLEKSKGPVEVLVIDRVEKPSAN